MEPGQVSRARPGPSWKEMALDRWGAQEDRVGAGDQLGVVVKCSKITVIGKTLSRGLVRDHPHGLGKVGPEGRQQEAAVATCPCNVILSR